VPPSRPSFPRRQPGTARPARRATPAVRERKRRARLLGGNARPRIAIGRIVLVAVLVVAGLRLIDVQGFQAGQLSAAAEQQRERTINTPAERGTITDRDGTKLAFSVDSDALSYQPKDMRKKYGAGLTVVVGGKKQVVTYDQHTQAVADELAQLLGSAVNEQLLLSQLRSDKTFVYLVQQVDPAIAAKISADFPDVAVEDRSVRQYPDGSVGANVIGLANWRLDETPPALGGVFGLEASMNARLAGKPGVQVADIGSGNDNLVIPNTVRDVQQAVPGESVQLTLDADLQYVVQQKLQEYVKNTGAKDGSAVVLDAHTGEVYALANDQTFNPNDRSTITNTNVGDQAVTSPYEPGSVNKVVTAAAAIQYGLVTPTSPITIPPFFQNGDKRVTDDWSHGTDTYTVTGIFAKSSNIGADILAAKVGPQRFDQMLYKMGLGQKTGIELPGESPGYVPPMNKWSGSTFGNLPIGQGLSMTILQMAGMYQTIANDGVRVPPRIIKSVTEPDGTVVPTKQPAGIRVVSAQTAQTVRMMMRAVTQSAKSPQEGTGVSAAVPGYQISGKTGTAQLIDPKCGCYSVTQNRVTFAGILSADNPRFVVGIMLDAPNGDVEGGQTAAPLFHEIASYLAQRYNLPVSTAANPYVPLVVSP
jgi:cell division protein FtsI (penicillin-binding protein 3)